ncbi:VOC family protein [Arvimicrobium flavum]|uniref:VOC family protein n=1 Tax=Arvimicrobium flavum TaxID=3393320 RepID=UPI00237AD561|nr:VOC family protein [Mesorhizobium shangrilense]
MAVETRLAPFLMFEGRAEEAMTFYISLIPDSRVLSIERYGAAGPGKEGSVVVASFSLGGTTVMCSDSHVKHGFTFTPSTSLFLTCASEEEIGRMAAALSEGGQFLMPPGSYGFSRRFAWVNDRFGVSWQLNLP